MLTLLWVSFSKNRTKGHRRVTLDFEHWFQVKLQCPFLAPEISSLRSWIAQQCSWINTTDDVFCQFSLLNLMGKG